MNRLFFHHYTLGILMKINNYSSIISWNAIFLNRLFAKSVGISNGEVIGSEEDYHPFFFSFLTVKFLHSISCSAVGFHNDA